MRDELAWDWSAFRRPCFAAARRILGEADAEDAVQAAFLRAWHHRASCRDPARPLPWLIQITRNEALRLASRRAAEGLPSESAELDHVAAPCPIDAFVTATEFRRAVAALPEGDRRLAVLRYTLDLPNHEIARQIGVTEGTAKVRLHRLRGKLRKALEEN